MKSRFFALATSSVALWTTVVVLGCEAPAADTDAGELPDGGADAEVLEPCTRDRDCSDERFCTGEERCRPGEAGADARGCVTLPPPCEPSECDEASDTCAACAVELRDADGDGYVARACGGNDCDDADPAINPGATELCDAAGVDEDCNPETWGADGDADGAFAVGCCQLVSGGELECGADCDDGDDAILPGAAERCNALDDDCDGMADEDFECVQSVAASGPNACGRDGTRRCSPSCAWLDDDFYRAESASSCDYCDDSGMGLGEEIPFATTMDDTVVTDGWAAHGDARRTCWTFMSMAYCTWWVVDDTSERGALYVPSPVRLGYGPTYVQARVTSIANRSAGCSPFPCAPFPLAGGWALVVLADSATEFVGTEDTAALPASPGLAIVWAFSHVPECGGICLPVASDALSLEELRTTGAPRRIARTTDVDGDQDGPMNTTLAHSVWIQITPDDPRTAPDESALAVLAPFGSGLSCANDSTTPCGVSFSPGQEIHIGVTAVASSENDISVALTDVTSTRYGLCAP